MREHTLSVLIADAKQYKSGKVHGQVLKLPATKEEVSEVFNDLDIDKDNYVIVSVSSEIKCGNHIFKKIENPIDESSDLNEVNYYSALVKKDLNNQRRKAIPIIEGYSDKGNLIKIIKMLLNPKSFYLVDFARDYEDLGKFMFDLEIPDSMKEFVEYGKYGKEVHRNLGGKFITYGYLYQVYSLRHKYRGIKDIPKEYIVL